MISLRNNDLLHHFLRHKVPLTAFIELTSRCDLKCIHCMRSKTPSPDLTKSICHNLLDQLARMGTLNVTFSGGEPLLHKDFFDLIAYARQKNFNVKIASNGIGFNKSNVRRFKALQPITVQLSLYGTSPALHDLITRTKGSFKKAIRAIRLLKDSGISVLIHMIVLKENFHELGKMKTLAKAEGWNFSYDFVLYPRDNGSLEPLYHRITGEQLGCAVRKGWVRQSNFIVPKSRYAGTTRILDLATVSCRVSPSAQVFPSGTVRLEIGNLRRDSFRDIWLKSPEVHDLRKLKTDDFECSRCRLYQHCSWDIGLAFAEHGSVTATPDEWCRFVRQLESK